MRTPSSFFLVFTRQLCCCAELSFVLEQAKRGVLLLKDLCFFERERMRTLSSSMGLLRVDTTGSYVPCGTSIKTLIGQQNQRTSSVNALIECQ